MDDNMKCVDCGAEATTGFAAYEITTDERVWVFLCDQCEALRKIPEIREELNALRRVNAEMCAVLAPFADAANQLDDEPEHVSDEARIIVGDDDDTDIEKIKWTLTYLFVDNDPNWNVLVVGHLRAARDLLTRWQAEDAHKDS